MNKNIGELDDTYCSTFVKEVAQEFNIKEPAQILKLCKLAGDFQRNIIKEYHEKIINILREG